MATCDTCGKPFGLFEGAKSRCNLCRNRNLTPENYASIMEADARGAKRAQEYEVAPQAEQVAAVSRVKDVILTTEGNPSGLTIVARMGIVTAECVFGMHLFKDIFAIGRDIFGGRSTALQNTLKDARETALEELRAEAASRGANAVIAVDLDYSEISGGGKSMLFLVASGTAVQVEATVTTQNP